MTLSTRAQHTSVPIRLGKLLNMDKAAVAPPRPDHAHRQPGSACPGAIATGSLTTTVWRLEALVRGSVLELALRSSPPEGSARLNLVRVTE